MRLTTFTAVLLGLAVLAAGAETPTPNKAKAANDAFMARLLKAARASSKGHTAAAHHAAAKNVTHTDEPFGLARKVTMDFSGLIEGQEVNGFYGALGLEWDPRPMVFGAQTLENIGASTNLPTPDFIVVSDTYAAVSSKAGLVGGVRFAYATSEEIREFVAMGYHYQLPSVAAWSGEAGMGTKLAEATLPWTVGNFTYPSSWGGLKWKGVAKSVTFSPAVIEGYSLMATALFADVSVTVLSNKTAPLGGKVADAVTELGAKATDAKAAVASLKGAMPDLPALPKKMGE